MVAQEPAHRKVPLGVKLGSGVGNIADNVLSYAVSFFLLFYATSVCGLPGSWAGAALAIGLVIDAVLDPLIGSLSDGWRSRYGRRVPFMMVGLPIICLSFVALFSLPAGVSHVTLFIYLTLASVAFRVSMSTYLLPFQATAAELTQDYDQRSSIIAWRWGLGMLGTLVMIAVSYGIFFSGPNGLSDRAAYTPFAIAMASLGFVGGSVAIWRLKRAYQSGEVEVAEHVPAHGHNFFQQIGELARNRNFRLIFAASVLFFTAFGTQSAVGVHVKTFFWRLQPADMQIITFTSFLGVLLGAPLAGPLLKRVEKRTVALVGMFCLALASSLPATLKISGVLDLDRGQLVILLSCLGAVSGMLMASAAIAIASMTADATDEHELMFDARREGIFFAGFAFAGKAANGAGILLAGIIVQIANLPAMKPGSTEAPLVDPASLTTLGLIYGPGAFFVFLGAVALMSRSTLTRERHAEILTQLAGRNAARLTPATA